MRYSVKNFEVGPIMTNCYFLVNEDLRQLIVIDPGGDAGMLVKSIESMGRQPVAILLTHGHFDHAAGADEIAKRFDIQVYAHEAEKETLENPRYNLGAMGGESKAYHADIFLKDGQILNLAGFEIEVLHTPGHTPGGISFYLKEQKILFSGDSLFCQSIGRTDFPNGSASQLIRSVSEKLLTLPDDVQVFAGHEQTTTIGFEKKHNPFF